MSLNRRSILAVSPSFGCPRSRKPFGRGWGLGRVLVGICLLGVGIGDRMFIDLNPFARCAEVLPKTGVGPVKPDSQAESGPVPGAKAVSGQSPVGDGQAPALEAAKAPAASPVPPGRLIDQEPYDRIILNAANDNAVLEVLPLDLPNRQVPAKPTKPLIVRLLNRPETQYEVSWSAIAKVEFFEQRVLQEAVQHVRQGRFEEAYEYFHYLYQHYPKMAGLDTAYEDALWEEASAWYRKGQYDRTLVVLRTLWERNKDRPQLDQAMGLATEKLVEQYVSAEQYESARALLRELAGCYPQQEVVIKWEGQFRAQAAALQAHARDALEKNALREASEAARKMLQIWPSLPGAAELAQEIRQKYPRVVVGVTMPGRPEAALPSTALAHEPNAAASSPLSCLSWVPEMGDWSARRIRRLLSRQWMELVAPGSEGGQYQSPVGQLRIEELGQCLIFQIRPNILDVHGRELTGYQLAQVLLNLANPRSAAYRPEWADRVVAVEVQDIYTVEVTLRRAHVRPEAFLSLPIPDLPGPYQVLPVSGQEKVFLLHPQYFALSPTQPKEIVETPFAKTSQALAALRAGKVHLVDRVPPGELDRLRQNKDLVVDSYAIPLVHVLVPNRNRALVAHPRFGRALEYGIPREAILRHICGGKNLPGFQVLSGPVPPGVAHDDPVGYAYDRSQNPRAYNPRLALALARVTWEEVAGQDPTKSGQVSPSQQAAHASETALPKAASQASKSDQVLQTPGLPEKSSPVGTTHSEPTPSKPQSAGKPSSAHASEMPPLVLLYPPTEIARTACRAIQRSLKVVGIPIRLQEVHPADLLGPTPPEFDLVYVELAIQEPVTDLPRLFGSSGSIGWTSPFLAVRLGDLYQAPSWQGVQEALRNIHKITAQEVPFVPLWQTVEYFAYRKSLQAVGSHPVFLYENVEQWQMASEPSPEPSAKPAGN